MDTISRFIDAINLTDLQTMMDCLSTYHIFTDSQDNTITNKALIEKAWSNYFAIFPDYHIEITERIENEDHVVLLGYASGTYKYNSRFWKTPSAWHTKLHDNKISLWQVYADNSLVLEIMEEGK
jgi:ketosteroid isomerase-like protein